jgi:histone deacetylase complex regulatory component SIN3
MIKDIIELRENERRKTINLFKPLNDIDFTNSTRITPSYVEMPWSYPVSCRNKTKELKGILNDKWVSVPYGSEHSHFSIRIKNQYEELLLKSEDERY